MNYIVDTRPTTEFGLLTTLKTKALAKYIVGHKNVPLYFVL